MTSRQFHRWVGTVAAVLFFLVAATGVVLQCQQIFGAEETAKEDFARTVSPQKITQSLLSAANYLDAARETVAAQYPTASIASFDWQFKSQPPLIIFHLDTPQKLLVSVDPELSRITKVASDEESWILRLHTGEILGDGGKVLGLFWGIALVGMTITGVILYLQMVRGRARTGRTTGIRRWFWVLLLSLLSLNFPARAASPLTGNILLTGNASVQDRPLPSLNERLTLDYTLPDKSAFDLRVENYTESSYNQNPPGILGRNINEHKFEIQGTYTYPLNDIFSVSGALLHHANFTFKDNYQWGITALTAKIPLMTQVTLIPTLSLEKRLAQGGRFFFDSSTTLDYSFAPHWTFETNFHRYENFGEFDPKPTQKEEIETGFIRELPPNQIIGISFFRHTQYHAPNDQFSFVKLKYDYLF